VLGEGLLENDLSLGQHAGVLRALERVLRGGAELADLRVGLRQVRLGGLLLLLQIFDLRGDRLDLLTALRLRRSDLLVDRLRRGTRAQTENECRTNEYTENGFAVHRLPFLSFLPRVATRGGSVPK